MSIESIASIGQADKLTFTNIESIAPPPKHDGVSFSQLLEGGVKEVNETLASANVQLEKLALNQPVSTHDLMITLEKAKLHLQLTIEVRNKLVEGYQELMRMQL